MDHCQLALWYAERNRLPAELTAAVFYHHAPEDADHDRSLVALVAAADYLANHLRGPGGAYDPRTNPGLALLAGGWDEARRSGLHHSILELSTPTPDRAASLLVAV